MTNKIKSKGAIPEVARTSTLRLIRPSRLAALLDCDRSTVSRWQQTGVLPPPVQIGGVRGWFEHDLRELLERRQATEKKGA
jgi:predicted DNA-binding transcriptional regulator AlpA